MSQSTTLYSVSPDVFEKLNQPGNKQPFNMDDATSDATFQGSFMALEYYLGKGKDSAHKALAYELFNPAQALGADIFDGLTDEEKMEFYGSGLLVPYLDVPVIERISQLVDALSVEDMQRNYNAKELNDQGIYPGVWHDDNSPNMAYNLLHITEDLQNLKAIIKEAVAAKNYLLVFAG